MAFINISELRPAGAELFQDSESYLNELNEQEVSLAIGGDGGSDITSSVISVNTYSASINSVSVVSQVKTDVTVGFSKVTW